MIELRFDTDAMARVRFAVSPTWEMVLSIRALTAAPTGLHASWLRQIRPRLSEVDLPLLTALVRPAGYIPDFLLPAPARRSPTMDSGLAQIANGDTALVVDQLTHLSEHPLAQSGTGRDARVRLLRELIAAPEVALTRIVAELGRWWQTAVEPFWPRIRILLHDDITHRLEQLATGGAQQMFRTLHPRIAYAGNTVRISKYASGVTQLHWRGLLLVPCAFAWPDVLVGTADDPNVPILMYSPHGLGRLWQVPQGAAAEPVAAVLGRSRAALLAQLDLPLSTTHLAGLLDLAAPTVNVHLKALTAAGIVTARREGHSVLYRRTRLGDLLLAGHA